MNRRSEISMFMTCTPHTIGSDQTIVRARRMMEDANIRHLPVLDGGHLVGLLSERDLEVFGVATERQGGPIRVGDVMSVEPYSVSSDAPLSDVVAEMARRRVGSAVVVENEHVVGIFTAVDALSALSCLLVEEERKPRPAMAR